MDDDGDVIARPDYICLRGLLLVEIKALETSPKERIDAAITRNFDKEELPLFFGQWPAKSILKNVADKDAFKKAMFTAISRASKDHLRKANRQFSSYRSYNPRQNRMNLVILINEDHIEYDPDIVMHILWREFNQFDVDGNYRFQNIDAVMFISERHGFDALGTIHMPILTVQNRLCDNEYWKASVLRKVARDWSLWNKRPFFEGKEELAAEFVPFEHVNAQMARHEQWRLNYRRNPYMARWDDRHLQYFWDRTILTLNMKFFRGCPCIPSDKEVEIAFVRFTEINEEMARRGLPLQFMRPDPQRYQKVIASMPVAETVKSWLRLNFAADF